MTTSMRNQGSLSKLTQQVATCTLCTDLELGPKPLVQLDSQAKILIAGQAPGSKAHINGVLFDDPSGARLREWMGIEQATFYDKTKIAILPMAFCYPGKGKAGDLPPPRQCARTWRKQLLAALPNIELTLLIGQHAINWHLDKAQHNTLTHTVGHWQDYWPQFLPMPHPSPRNNRWLKKNPWFFKDILPKLKDRVAKLV